MAVNFTKEELIRIAELSALKLDDAEIESFVKQLQAVLEFTQDLSSCTTTREVENARNINVFRDDTAIRKNPTPLLQIAPQTEDSYFVVPAILE